MTIVEKVKKLLVHPVTRGLDIDDPQTTQLRRTVIEGNKFPLADL